jgi:predicted N-formylglutamate amidohydrolase
VPGNIGLSERHKLPRVREILRPYTIASRPSSIGDEKPPDRQPLISVHSFTPVFKTVARLWHVGVLYTAIRVSPKSGAPAS